MTAPASQRLAGDFAARSGIVFREPSLLRQALTHSGGGGKEGDYQRLEFLGDRVLGLVIAEELLKRFPSDDEGRLARRLNWLVRREACARVARDLKLDELMLTAKTTRRGQAAASQKVLSDLCEAVIAAIYLDQGLPVARDFILAHWAPLFAAHREAARDAKSALQELAAARKLATPAYRVVGREGPDHAPRFTVEVAVDGAGAARGEGGSKRAAEQAAAEELLKHMTKDQRDDDQGS